MSDKSFHRLIISIVAAVCVIHIWGAFLLELKKMTITTELAQHKPVTIVGGKVQEQWIWKH